MSTISISGVQGSVVGVGVSGTGTIVGQNVTVGSVSVGAVPPEAAGTDYAAALKAFSEQLNQVLQAQQVPQEQVAPVQECVDAIAAQVAELPPPDQPLQGPKKFSLKGALEGLAAGLLKVLPDAAQTVVAMTPLAPFGSLIGKGLDEVVKSVQAEG
jgi:hypothetical protein